MEEEQIKDIIKKLTVRVKATTNIDSKTITEQGTGILLLQDNRAYVLTVHHCIYGKTEPFHEVLKDDIEFSFINEMCSETLIPIDIKSFKENLVLLEIDIKKLSDIDINCIYLDRVYDGKKYYLRGFPESEVHNFEATCNDRNVDDVTFKIDVDRLDNDSSGEKAITYIGGLSGSGVFFSENNQLYLVGLVNQLRDKFGKFNAVHCTKLVDLKSYNIKLSELKVYNKKDINIPSIQKEKNLHYINQLIKSYNSDSSDLIEILEDIENSKYDRHLKTARKSFHMAETLRNFSRDNLPEDTYEDFQDDIYEGIINTVEDDYENAFKKVKATENESTRIAIDSYPIKENKCKTIERKGVCHQLVNDDRISWIDNE